MVLHRVLSVASKSYALYRTRLIITLYNYWQMQDEQAPISFKERLARYEQLMKNANGTSNPSPTFKNTNSKPTPVSPPPSQPTHTSPSPPQNTKNQGEVESPAIVKPSLNKSLGASNTLNLQSNSSWRMSTGPTTSSDYQPEPNINLQPNRASVSVTTSEGVDSQSVLPVNIMRQMLEGKNLNLNQPGQSQPSRKFVVPEPEGQNDSGERQAPTIETNTNMGSVKENAQKLGLFFLNQRESEKAKVEQEQNGSQLQRGTPQESQPTMPAPQQNNTQNISGNTNFYVPPELTQPASSEKSQVQSGGQQQGGNLMARMIRKKKAVQNFDSDEDE